MVKENIFPKIEGQKVPYVSVSEMKKIDRMMIQEYEIFLLQMMENAGLNLALLVNKFFTDKRKIVIFAGKGNNGGGGLVAARRLSNWGKEVKVILASKLEELTKIPLHQFVSLEKMDVEVVPYSAEEHSDINLHNAVLIDSLLGYNLQGNPRGTYKQLINLINKSHQPVLSLDIPSGMNGSSGDIMNPTIKADITLTLALPKLAFKKKRTKHFIGNLFLADISVPPKLYEKLNIIVPRNLFTQSTIVEIK